MSNPPKDICGSNRAVAWICRKLRRAQQWRVTHLSVGRWGERTAGRYLNRHGLHIIRRNWKASRLEADLIAYDSRQLIIVEVKTRHFSLQSNFPAVNAITEEKRRHLASLQRRLLHNNGPLCRRYNLRSVRVDIVEVYYQRFFGLCRRATAIRWHKAFNL
jgi:Holliday junction resolvase-like predicted endonuclease